MSGTNLLPLSLVLSSSRSKSTVLSNAPMPRMFSISHFLRHFSVRDRCSGAVIISDEASFNCGKLSARQTDWERVLLPPVIYIMLSEDMPVLTRYFVISTWHTESLGWTSIIGLCSLPAISAV